MHAELRMESAMHKSVLALVVASSLPLIPALASAETYGSVKVECWGDCSRVLLGDVCDSFRTGSRPISVACDDTATPGTGASMACGNGATCIPWGTLLRTDSLGAYCADSGGNDAVVACGAP